MTVTIEPAGESCKLIERTNSSSAIFPVPITKAALVALLTAILGNPAARETATAPVNVDRMRDGLRVHVGSGSFFIRYPDVFPLVLE